MAVTDITRQTISPTMATPTYAAANAGGMQCLNDDRTFFQAKNTNGSTRTITVTAQQTTLYVQGFGNLTIGNLSYTIPITTGDKMFQVPLLGYNDGNGKVQLTFDAVADLTIAAFQLAKV